MRIFLTGASGFIGKNLVAYMLDRDCQLTCLLRDPQRLPEPLRTRVTVVTGDVTIPGAETAAALARSDAVVHLAAKLWSHTYQAYDMVNHQGAEAMVAAATSSAGSLRRFVMVSSLAAMGPAPLGHPVTETNREAPISWYGMTKLAGERALERAAFPWTVLRPPMVYGPYDRGIRRFFTMATRHLRPHLHGGRMEISLIHVQDVCQAIWLALTAEDRPRSTYFLNDGHPIHRVKDVVDLVVRLVGTWTVPLPVPRWALRAAESALTLGPRFGWSPKGLTADKLREAHQRAWTCDSGRIAADLGFKPAIALAHGMPALADWYRVQGLL